MRLSSKDFEAILRVLPELYASRSRPDFLAASLRIIGSLIPADAHSWTGFTAGSQSHLTTLVETDNRASARIRKRLEETMLTHPFHALWQKFGLGTALMLTDVPTRALDVHLGESGDVYRMLGVRHNLSLPVGLSSDEVMATSAVDARRPFTERDRTVFNLLLPHLRQTLANISTLERLHSKRDLTVRGGMQPELTARENDVALWLAQGKTDREIAQILGIAKRTVEKHVEQMLRKLGVENRTSAAITLRTSTPD
jgi:DNA-binding CsgD family transcriptional regulator